MSPSDGADGRDERGRALADREEEEGGLPAFAEDREEHDRREPDCRPGRDRARQLRLELLLDVHRLLPHPEDHPGEDGDGREHRDALEDLLGAAFELADGEEERRTREDRESDGGGGADPDDPEVAPVVGLGQIAQDDPDDQRGLEAFPCRYQRGAHGSSPPCRVRADCKVT